MPEVRCSNLQGDLGGARIADYFESMEGGPEGPLPICRLVMARGRSLATEGRRSPEGRAYSSRAGAVEMVPKIVVTKSRRVSTWTEVHHSQMASILASSS